MPNASVAVPPPFVTVDDALTGLAQLERDFLSRQNRRGVFVTAYGIITRTLTGKLGSGFFHDDGWVQKYLLAFANLYRKALEDYEAKRRPNVPPSWQQSFDTSVSGLALIIQDLLLGINAHINRDLGFALVEAGIDDSRETRYSDHTKVNDALAEATQEVQDQITAMYAAGLGPLDRLLGQLDEEITAYNFALARENAWASGVALAGAASAAERERIAQVIDSRAVVLGSVLLRANSAAPWLIDLLRRIEEGRRWWELLAHPQVRVILERRTALANGLPSDLDEVIRRLGELIDIFDRERNRLSIYTTVYQAITKEVKDHVEAGKFKDPDWMVSLDLHFASRFFGIIEAYRNGRPDQIPVCWLYAIESVMSRKTMVAQDIAVQIAPRVVFDLPITLVEAGLDRDLENRKHDYEATYAIFINELDCIQETIARKYSALVTFYDALGGPLDEAISNRLYTQARQEAWADGLALHAAGSQVEKDRIVRGLDYKARRAIDQVLFHNRPPMSWIVQLLRNAEDAFSGDWSGTVEDCT